MPRILFLALIKKKRYDDFTDSYNKYKLVWFQIYQTKRWAVNLNVSEEAED